MRVLPATPLNFFVGETGHPIEVLVRDSEVDPTELTAEFQLLSWAAKAEVVAWSAASISEIVEHPTPTGSYWTFRVTFDWTVDQDPGVYVAYFRLVTALDAKWVIPPAAGMFVSITGALPE